MSEIKKSKNCIPEDETYSTETNGFPTGAQLLPTYLYPSKKSPVVVLVSGITIL